MRYLDIFNKELHKLGIFDEIIDILSNDKGILWEYYGDRYATKNNVKQRMKQLI